MYYDDNRIYPSVTGCTAANYNGPLTTALPASPTYRPAVPLDPLNSGSNVYMYATNATSAAQRYVLRAYFELHNAAHDTDVDGTVYACSCGANGATAREYCIQP